MHICVVYTCLWQSVHYLCVCIWKPKADGRYLPQTLSNLYIEMESLNAAWACSFSCSGEPACFRDSLNPKPTCLDLCLGIWTPVLTFGQWTLSRWARLPYLPMPNLCFSNRYLVRRSPWFLLLQHWDTYRYMYAHMNDYISIHTCVCLYVCMCINTQTHAQRCIFTSKK